MVFERRRMHLPAKNGRIKCGPTAMSHLILYLLEVKRLQKSEGREVRLCLQQARRRFDPVIHSTLFQLTEEDGQRRISVSMLAQSINQYLPILPGYSIRTTARILNLSRQDCTEIYRKLPPRPVGWRVGLRQQTVYPR